MFKMVLSRNPSPRELDVLDKQIQVHLARYNEGLPDAQQLVQLGETKPQTDLDPALLAAYTLVASTILNMDETLTRN